MNGTKNQVVENDGARILLDDVNPMETPMELEQKKSGVIKEEKRKLKIKQIARQRDENYQQKSQVLLGPHLKPSPPSRAPFVIPQSPTYSLYFSPKHNPSLHRAAVGFTVAAWFVVVVRQSSCFVVLEGPSIPPTSASPGPAPPLSVCRVRRRLPVVRRQLASVRRQLPLVRRSHSNLWSLPSPKASLTNSPKSISELPPVPPSSRVIYETEFAEDQAVVYASKWVFSVTPDHDYIKVMNSNWT
ncbi:hypothetical protein AHAS_Ahas02G0059000 [Arachis hypogaea]